MTAITWGQTVSFDYAKAKRDNIIAGKTRLRDCSEHELLALETSLKNAVIWADPPPATTRRP